MKLDWARLSNIGVVLVILSTASTLNGCNSGSTAQSNSSASANVNLPQTGQTPISPLTALGGYDGFTYIGVPWAYVTSGPTTPAARFVDTGDGSHNCITDNLTGLVWEKNPSSNKYPWAMSLTNVVAGGALPSTLCGFSDWRLPNLNELLSLVNYSQFNQHQWLQSQGFTNIQNGYWSSSTYAPDPEFVWVLGMYANSVDVFRKDDSGFVDDMYVWAVRGSSAPAIAPSPVLQTGQTPTTPVSPAPTGSDGALQKGVAWPSPRFVVASDGSGNCITDNLTGLTWESTPSSNKYIWESALVSPAMPANLCGFSDWRLPNINELRSLVNLSESNQQTWLQTQGFSNVQADRYWTSTSLAPDSNTPWERARAWYVDFSSGTPASSRKSYTRDATYVWAVRGGH